MRSQATYEISLAKESFKFSAAHFTVFDKSTAERLHGHNYYVSVKARFADVETTTCIAVDFQVLKSDIQAACDKLDEYVLLPTESSFLRVAEDGANVTARFSEKLYSFPVSDVRRLPVSNITCESLCQLLGSKLLALWESKLSEFEFQGLTVSVEETRGQSVSWSSNVRSGS